MFFRPFRFYRVNFVFKATRCSSVSLLHSDRVMAARKIIEVYVTMSAAEPKITCTAATHSVKYENKVVCSTESESALYDISCSRYILFKRFNLIVRIPCSYDLFFS